MISIQRSACPKALQGSSGGKRRYRNQSVVNTLHSMQHGKCCYCECDIPAKGHGKAVEHFQPIATFRKLQNDWNNLLLACQRCNGKKRDEFPTDARTKAPLLINPSDSMIDPEDHLDFIVDLEDEARGLIRAKNGSRRGKKTIEAIGLDYIYYTQQHKRHLFELVREYLVLLEASSRGHDAELQRSKGRLRMMLSAKNKFSAVARAFAKRYSVDAEFSIEIPEGVTE